MRIVSYQPELSPALREVTGNVDYTEFRESLERIDRLLIDSGIECGFVLSHMEAYEKDLVAHAESMGKLPRQISEKERGKVQEQAVKALRCNVARELTGESARGLSVRLADSELLGRLRRAMNGLDGTSSGANRICPGCSTTHAF